MRKKTAVRVASAAVALAIFFGLYYLFNIDGVKMLILGIVLVAQWEYSEITFLKCDRTFALPLVFLFITCGQIIAQGFLGLDLNIVSGSVVLFMLPSIMLLLFRANRDHKLESSLVGIFSFFFGLVYLGVLPGMILKLLTIQNGFHWLITLMFIVFLGDTMAYFSGLLLGKRKILPELSPKKTVVGSVGGLFGSVVGGLAGFLLFFSQSQSVTVIIVASILAGALGQCGDFFESLLKRVANVKDSGKIMPGHGGVLDRIDAILFAAPVLFWLTLSLV